MHDALEKLEKISGSEECSCDEGPPWDKCSSCLAAGILNQAAEDLNYGLETVLERIEEEKKEKERFSE